MSKAKEAALPSESTDSQEELQGELSFDVISDVDGEDEGEPQKEQSLGSTSLNTLLSKDAALQEEVENKIQLAVAEETKALQNSYAKAADVLQGRVITLLRHVLAKAPAAKRELLQIKKLVVHNSKLKFKKRKK